MSIFCHKKLLVLDVRWIPTPIRTYLFHLLNSDHFIQEGLAWATWTLKHLGAVWVFMDSCTWHEHVGFSISCCRSERTPRDLKTFPKLQTQSAVQPWPSAPWWAPKPPFWLQNFNSFYGPQVKYGGIPVIRNRLEKTHENATVSYCWYPSVFRIRLLIQHASPLDTLFCQPVEGSFNKLSSFTNQPCQQQTSAWCSSATIIEDSSWKHARDRGGQLKRSGSIQEFVAVQLKYWQKKSWQKIYQLREKWMFHDVSTCLMDCVTCFLGFSTPCCHSQFFLSLKSSPLASMRCSSCPKTPCCMESVVLVGAAGKLCPPGLWDSWEHLITTPDLSLFYPVLICSFLSAPNQWVWNQNAAWPNFLASWRQAGGGSGISIPVLLDKTETQNTRDRKDANHGSVDIWWYWHLRYEVRHDSVPQSVSAECWCQCFVEVFPAFATLLQSTSLSMPFLRWPDFSTETTPVSSARLPHCHCSGRSPPESLKGVPPWMQSLG